MKHSEFDTYLRLYIYMYIFNQQILYFISIIIQVQEAHSDLCDNKNSGELKRCVTALKLNKQAIPLRKHTKDLES